ncbi:uncharacterized protein LOC127122967 [Lathyrus oleraceus]|uniref:uncharacterized protein LOC127122967 n=1 Tax=Pisum sativum TaxID=3888 RepID=UPI0021D162F1|nr:uncharacterized protein LOC127122967 [Pisum sativum]
MEEDQNYKPLKEFSLSSKEEPHSSIFNPTITANNFALNPALLQIVQQNQFAGLQIENPNQHIKVFIQLDDALKYNNITPEKVFLARYFPPSKTAVLRNQITRFTQLDGESLLDAGERYKELLRACPHHGLEQWLIIHTLYNGLLYNTKMTIDAAASGALIIKPYPKACTLFEDVAQNHYQWGTKNAQVEKKETEGGIYEVSSLDHMNAKMDALTQKVESLVINPTTIVASVQPGCKIYGTPGHVIAE